MAFRGGAALEFVFCLKVFNYGCVFFVFSPPLLGDLLFVFFGVSFSVLFRFCVVAFFVLFLCCFLGGLDFGWFGCLVT